MYIERKSDERDRGPARIGRVKYSATRRTLCYDGKSFQSLRGAGVSGNYFDIDTLDEYWISGPKRNGEDRHWAGGGPVTIDPDVAEEYWRDIRGCEAPK